VAKEQPREIQSLKRTQCTVDSLEMESVMRKGMGDRQPVEDSSLRRDTANKEMGT